MLPPWLLAACAVPIVLVLYKSINDGIFTGSTAVDEKLRAYLEKLEAKCRARDGVSPSTDSISCRQRMTWPKCS